MPPAPVDVVSLARSQMAATDALDSNALPAATAQLFVVLIVTSFIIISAFILRIILHAPTNSSLSAHLRHQSLLMLPSESDALNQFNYPSSLFYGATAIFPLHSQSSAEPTYEALLELEDVLGPVKTGLSEEQIDVLPCYTVDAKDKSNSRPAFCTICRDDIGHMDVIRTLPCGDEFHANCIGRWLKMRPSCPLCRTRFG